MVMKPRTRNMAKRITVHNDICNGKLVIRGTRVTVGTILEFPGAGDSIDDVLEEYPTLEREDVLACIEYGSNKPQSERK